MFVFLDAKKRIKKCNKKRYMKPVRIIFVGLICGIVTTAHADVASVQWVESILSALDVSQPDWSQTDTTAEDYIKNKPTIPTVNNATLTIQKNGTTVDTWTSNASENKTVNITVPTTASDVDAVAATQSTKGGILTTNSTTGDVEVSATIAAGSVSGLATVATTGAYSDLAGTPTIPTVNDATLTIQKNGTAVDTFTANASSNKTINITVPTTASDVGLGNVQNVDQTNAANITSGTIGVARLPVGTTSTTVAAGDDARFDSVSTTQPSGTPPTGRVWVWFN